LINTGTIRSFIDNVIVGTEEEEGHVRVVNDRLGFILFSFSFIFLYFIFECLFPFLYLDIGKEDKT